MMRSALCTVTLSCFLYGGHALGNGMPVPAEVAGTPLFDEEEVLFAAPTREDRIGRIVAPVTINGRGPFRLILDTGANQTVLSTALANELGLAPNLDGGVVINGVTGSALVPTVRLDSLQTGDLVQRDVDVPVVNSVMGGAHGILGMRGFDGKRIAVDFGKNEILITNSRGQRAPSYAISIPAKVRFGRLLVVDGRVGRVRVKAIIDTGGQRTLGNIALRDALVRKRSFRHQAIETGVIGLTNEEQAGHEWQSPAIQLGEAQLRHVPVIYGDIHVFKLWGLENEPALLIGMDVLGLLRSFVVDYRREEIQIRP